MRMSCLGFGLVVAVLGVTPPAQAVDYAIDAAHSSVYFKISHLDLSSVYGRFNEFSGTFAIDPKDPTKCHFAMTIKPESVDTNQKARDEHLRGPDFFNVKQFPVMSFKSTAVKATPNGYEVTGDFTMHGETKPVTFSLVGGKTAEFPPGQQRTGYSTEFTLKRSNFGMTKFIDMLGDDVHVAVSFEGTAKK